MNATDKIKKTLARRHRAEKRFKLYGKLALLTAAAFLVFLAISIIGPGYTGFYKHEIRLPITPELLKNIPDAQLTLDEAAHLSKRALREKFPEADERREKFLLYSMMSNAAPRQLRDSIAAGNTEHWVMVSDPVDMFLKGRISGEVPEYERSVKDLQVHWLDALKAQGAVRSVFNSEFFTEGDSREPEQAGFWGSMVGSFFTIIVCLLLAFPLGVMAAIYLEEFAPKNRLTDVIEVNINNLAAVPSIIFGLLGLAVFLNVLAFPRSSPLVGGLTLALMTLPVIIITTRVSLKAVPNSLREAARGLGASPVQVVAHHVVPYALPGIMTGTILGTARAIGETAPLLMIGMVAFVADVPRHFLDPATAMPVQIYLWAGSPEAGFVEKTSTGIIVLLVMLLGMNSLAIYIRKRFETQW